MLISDGMLVPLEYPAYVIDNFLSQEECNHLLNDSIDFISSSTNVSKIHGGRLMLPWTSSEFRVLLNSSSSWAKLASNFSYLVFNLLKSVFHNSIMVPNTKSNAQFRSYLFSGCIVPFSRYILSTRLLALMNRKTDRSKFQSRVVSSFSTLGLFSVFVLRALDDIWRRSLSIFETLISFRALIPLFDYSFSTSGYNREIHRDSDSRLFVVLLYLNTMESESVGGNLELYDIKSSADNNCSSSQHGYPAQPESSICELQCIVQPRAGRLVVFANQYNSYHAVSEMKDSTTGRHFIYGGFTLPDLLLVDSKRFRNSKMPTEMHLY